MKYVLNKKFLRENPFEYISPQLLTLHAITDIEFIKLVGSREIESLTEEMQLKIEEQRKLIIEATEPEVIANLFRKNIAIILMPELLMKALEYEDEVFKSLLKKLIRNQHDEFIEATMRFLGITMTNYCDQILECYDDVLNPYTQSLLCIILGLRGEKDVVDKMFYEYNRLAHIGEDELYEEGPLLALHELFDRFYKKK